MIYDPEIHNEPRAEFVYVCVCVRVHTHACAYTSLLKGTEQIYHMPNKYV